jgi:prophage regulatory protein
MGETGANTMTDRILRKPDLPKITGLSARTCMRLEAAGQFPRRIQLHARAVGWRESDVIGWVADRENR